MKGAPRAKGPRAARRTPRAKEKRPVNSLRIRQPRRLTEAEQTLLTFKPKDSITWQESASMLMTMAPERWDLYYRRKHGDLREGRKD